MATAVNGIRITPNLRSGKGGWFCDIRIRHPVTREVIRERIVVRAANKTEVRRLGEKRRDQILTQGGKTAPVAPQERPVPTLAEFYTKRFVLEHLEAEGRKPSSIASVGYVFEKHLKPLLGNKLLDQITVADVQTVKARLTGWSKKTTNNVLAVLSSILHRAIDWNVIATMPRVKLLKAGKPTFSFFGFEELARLVEAAHGMDPRIEVMVLLGADAGLRRGEVIALEWPDVDFATGLLHVQRSECEGEVTVPKGGVGRHVPMTARLAQALRALCHLRGPRVLYNDKGRNLNATLAREWMLRATRKAALGGRGGLHQLRHTFCSHLAMKGVPPRVIQELAGHTTLAVTMRYMHLSPGATEQAIRLLEVPTDRGTKRAQPGVSATNRCDSQQL